MSGVENLHNNDGTTYKCGTQWIVGLGVSLLMMNLGIQVGWLSPNVAKLTAENSLIPLTNDQVSWLLSCNSFGAMIGSILQFFIMEMIGYKRTILLITVLMSVAWACLIVTNSIVCLFISIFLRGLVIPITLFAFVLFIFEVSAPEVRGIITSAATTSHSIGIIIGLVMETYFPMKLSNSVYFIKTLLIMIIFIWLQDSPQYYLKMRKIKKAKKSAAFYGINLNEKEELYKANIFTKSNNFLSLKSKIIQLKLPLVRKSMILITAIFILQNFTGVFCLISYMEIILTSGKFDLIDPKQFVIYIHIVSVVSSLLTLNLINKLYRRFLLMGSCIIAIISLITLGLYFYLLHNQFDVMHMQWIMIVSLFLNLTSFSVGLSRVVPIVFSELFSEEIKNLAASASSLTGFICSLILLKTYQPLVDFFGEEYIYWIYAATTAIMMIWILNLLPETKEKSLQEIQNELMK